MPLAPGDVFGRWTVLRLSRAGTKTRPALWTCRCECSAERDIAGLQLQTGRSTSCGCYRIERITKHGGHGSPEYKCWLAMVQRCAVPATHSFASYGGRGVVVCAAWLDYRAFLRDMGPRPPGTTLDRYPDGSGNYEPGNVRWATPAEQARNRKSTRLLTYRDETMCLTDWAQRRGMKMSTLSQRLKRGWSLEAALDTPTSAVLASGHRQPAPRS